MVESGPSDPSSDTIIGYGRCNRNHLLGSSVAPGGMSSDGVLLDGCQEFLPGGEEGTREALFCGPCGCHRSFHTAIHHEKKQDLAENKTPRSEEQEKSEDDERTIIMEVDQPMATRRRSRSRRKYSYSSEDASSDDDDDDDDDEAFEKSSGIHIGEILPYVSTRSTAPIRATKRPRSQAVESNTTKKSSLIALKQPRRQAPFPHLDFEKNEEDRSPEECRFRYALSAYLDRHPDLTEFCDFKLVEIELPDEPPPPPRPSKRGRKPKNRDRPIITRANFKIMCSICPEIPIDLDLKFQNLKRHINGDLHGNRIEREQERLSNGSTDSDSSQSSVFSKDSPKELSSSRPQFVSKSLKNLPPLPLIREPDSQDESDSESTNSDSESEAEAGSIQPVTRSKAATLSSEKTEKNSTNIGTLMKKKQLDVQSGSDNESKADHSPSVDQDIVSLPEIEEKIEPMIDVSKQSENTVISQESVADVPIQSEKSVRSPDPVTDVSAQLDRIMESQDDSVLQDQAEPLEITTVFDSEATNVQTTQDIKFGGSKEERDSRVKNLVSSLNESDQNDHGSLHSDSEDAKSDHSALQLPVKNISLSSPFLFSKSPERKQRSPANEQPLIHDLSLKESPRKSAFMSSNVQNSVPGYFLNSPQLGLKIPESGEFLSQAFRCLSEENSVSVLILFESDLFGRTFVDLSGLALCRWVKLPRDDCSLKSLKAFLASTFYGGRFQKRLKLYSYELRNGANGSNRRPNERLSSLPNNQDIMDHAFFLRINSCKLYSMNPDGIAGPPVEKQERKTTLILIKYSSIIPDGLRSDMVYAGSIECEARVFIASIIDFIQRQLKIPAGSSCLSYVEMDGFGAVKNNSKNCLRMLRFDSTIHDSGLQNGDIVQFEFTIKSPGYQFSRLSLVPQDFKVSGENFVPHPSRSMIDLIGKPPGKREVSTQEALNFRHSPFHSYQRYQHFPSISYHGMSQIFSDAKSTPLSDSRLPSRSVHESLRPSDFESPKLFPEKISSISGMFPDWETFTLRSNATHFPFPEPYSMPCQAPSQNFLM